MKEEHKKLLCLLKKAIATEDDGEPIKIADWGNLYRNATRQSVVTIIFDLLERKGENVVLPKIIMLEWLGQSLCQKSIYGQYVQAISKLASFYATQHIRMLLLKGYGLSLNYPKPELRNVGDIDIYLFGEKEHADDMVEQELNIPVNRAYHKHSNFFYEGVAVENHGKFFDDEKHRSNGSLELRLKELLDEDGRNLIESPISNCFLPSPTFNALFLMRHAGEHFATNEISLRHVLDLGFFFERFHNEIDWDYVLSVYNKEGMKRFYDSIATICVRDLGFNEESFSGYSHSYELADKVLADIFEDKQELPMNTSGIAGIKKIRYGIGKSLRWWNNRWKYRMVYNENLLESFLWLSINRLRH